MGTKNWSLPRKIRAGSDLSNARLNFKKVLEEAEESSVLSVGGTNGGPVEKLRIKGASVQDIEPNPNLYSFDMPLCVGNGTAEKTQDTIILQGDDNEGGSHSFSRGWAFIARAASWTEPEIVLQAGIEYTVSFDAKLLEQGSIDNTIRIYIRSTSEHLTGGGNVTRTLTSEYQRVSRTFTPNYTEGYTPNISLNSNKIEIKNIQVNAGTNTEYTEYGKPAALPHAPSPINPVPYEHNVVSCGRNLFNKLFTDIVYSTHNLTQTANGIRITVTSQASYLYAFDDYKHFLIAGETYTFKCKWKNSEIRGGKTYFVINRSGESVYSFGDTYWTNTNEKTTLYTFTPTESGYYRIQFYAYHHSSQGEMLENDYIDFWNIQLVKGTYTAETMPPYEQYTGKTLPRSVTDIAGNHYDLRSLPDGTADEVDWDNYLLQPYIGYGIITGAETISLYTNSEIGENYIGFTINTNLLNVKYYSRAENNFGRSNIGYIRELYTTCINSTTNLLMTPHSNGNLYCVLPKAMLSNMGYTVDIAGFTQMLQNLNNAGTPLEIEYKLATPPEPIPLRKYGETYDGQVWNKNEPIPTQIDYTTIYTSAFPQPTLSAKFPMAVRSPEYWIDGNKTFLTSSGGYSLRAEKGIYEEEENKEYSQLQLRGNEPRIFWGQIIVDGIKTEEQLLPAYHELPADFGIVLATHQTLGSEHNSLDDFLTYSSLILPPDNTKRIKKGKEPLFKFDKENNKWKQIENVYTRDADGLIVDHNNQKVVEMYVGSGTDENTIKNYQAYRIQRNSYNLLELNKYYKVADGDETYIIQRLSNGLIKYKDYNNLCFIVDPPRAGQAYRVVVEDIKSKPYPYRNYTINKKLNDGIHILRF